MKTMGEEEIRYSEGIEHGDEDTHDEEDDK